MRYIQEGPTYHLSPTNSATDFPYTTLYFSLLLILFKLLNPAFTLV